MVDYEYIWSQVQFKRQQDIDLIMSANKVNLYVFFSSEPPFNCLAGNSDIIVFYMHPFTQACVRMRVPKLDLVFGR